MPMSLDNQPKSPLNMKVRLVLQHAAFQSSVLACERDNDRLKPG
jgi:hypothetical protein